MKRFMRFAELPIGDMGINLRGGDARVAEHRLHRADIGAVDQEIGGKRVPQCVRRDFFGDAGADGVFFYHPLDAAGGKPGERRFIFWDADEQRRLGIGAAGDIGADRFAGALGSEDRTDFAAFAADAEFGFFQIDIGAPEICQFGNAESGGKKQFQNRFVAEQSQAVFGIKIQQPLHFFRFQKINLALGNFRQLDFFRRQSFDVIPCQEFQKRSEDYQVIILSNFF